MADTKISALSEASALTGAELILLSQGAADKQQDLATVRSELDWVRPADWPAMPATAANTMHLLAAVFDRETNYVAIRMSTSTGTYNVDWGDGTSSTGVASNATAEHNYSFSDVDLPAATSRGYKVAVVTVTANTGNFTVFNPNVVGTSLVANGPGQYLEMQVNGSALTQIGAFNTVRHPLCEHINIVAHGTVTSLFLGDMPSLQKLEYDATLLSNLTSLSSCFANNAALRRINLTGLSTSITTIASAFFGCTVLRELVFPSGTLGASLTNITGAFQNCSFLGNFTFPSGAFAGVTNAQNGFRSCGVARASEGLSLVFPSGAFVATTVFSDCFNSCGFSYLEFPSALAAATSIAGMLNSAILAHVKFASGGFGSVTTAGAVAGTNSGGVSRWQNFSCPISFTIANNRFGPTALDELYTALPTITSQTVTVTGNWGTTADTPSIATGKGWTVTG